MLKLCRGSDLRERRVMMGHATRAVIETHRGNYDMIHETDDAETNLNLYRMC